MEYIKLHVFIVCFTISKCFSHQSSLENQCGRIAYVFPLTNTRPVHLTFTPVQFDHDTDAQWMVDQDGHFASIFDVTNRTQKFNDSWTFHLKIDYSEEVKDFGDFKVKYGVCESSSLKLEFTDLGECGMLQVRPDDVISGQDAQLVYLPPLSAWANNDSVRVSWTFTPSYCGPDCEATDCAPDSQAVNIKGKYVVDKMPDVAEYVLTMPDVDRTQNGVYYVLCDNNSRTDNVTVKVIEPPSEPVISPLTTIDGTPYIIGRDKEPLDIFCNTMGGTDPVSAQFLVGKYDISAVQHPDGYTPDNGTKLTASDHMKDVTCEVSNRALKKPLVATAKIYMIETPVNPRLIGNEAIQFQPINISCLVRRARPAPNITFTIGSEVVMGGTMTITSDEEGYYNSKASIERIKRRWNGNDIGCCFSHELYTPPVTCSTKKKLTYKFKPNVLCLKLPVIVKEIRPYYVFNVTCVIENANPKCRPLWRGGDNLFLIKSPIYDVGTVDGGVTSRTTATLNVSQENNADIIKCEAECALFNKSTIIYEIKVPERPKVSINTSESNSSVLEVEYGESLVLECSVRSEPRSGISWKFSKNDTGVNVTKCGDQSLCLAIPFVGSIHNGPYTCFAENKFDAMERTIVLLVTGEPSDFGDVELGPLSNLVQLLLGIVGLLLFVFLVGGIVYVVARKMLREPESLASSKERPKTRSCFQSPSGHKKHQYDVTFKNTDDAATDDTKQTFPHQHDSSDDQAQDSSYVSLLRESKELSLQAWNRTYGNTDDLKSGKTGMLVTPVESDGEQVNTLLAEGDIQQIAPIETEESKDDQHAEDDASFRDMTSFRG